MCGGKRIETLDFLKTFAIFLVIWGHCLQYVVSGNPFEVPAYAWIKSFHMPLFMVLAGLFAKKGLQRLSLILYFRRRGQRLLIPVLSWGLVLFASDCLLYGDNSVGRLLNDVVYECLWFLKSLFVCGLLGLIAVKPKSNRIGWVVLSLIVSQMIPFWNVSIMYPCYLFGMLLTAYRDAIFKYKKFILIVSGSVFIVSSTIMAFSPSFWVITRGLKSALFEGTLFSPDIRAAITGVLVRNYSLIISGVSASAFMIVGIEVLSVKLKMLKLFGRIAKMGKYTLGVYTLQTIFIEKILEYIVSSRIEPSFLFVFIFAPLASGIAVLVFQAITRYVIERYNLLAICLFGESLKPKMKELEISSIYPE